MIARHLLLVAVLAVVACRRAPTPAVVADASPPPPDVATDSSASLADTADSAPRVAPAMTHWPDGATDSRRAILLLHGGGGPRYFTDLPDYRRYPEALAAAGYHVFIPHLVGCGHCISAAHDALAAIAKTPGVRGDRVGVIGFSAGAFRAFSIVASTPSDLPPIAAVVALYGGLNEPIPETSSFPPTLVLHASRARRSRTRWSEP